MKGTRRPSTSSADQPNSSSDAGFQSLITPPRSTAKIAAGAARTTVRSAASLASRARVASAISVTSRVFITMPWMTGSSSRFDSVDSTVRVVPSG